WTWGVRWRCRRCIRWRRARGGRIGWTGRSGRRWREARCWSVSEGGRGGKSGRERCRRRSGWCAGRYGRAGCGRRGRLYGADSRRCWEGVAVRVAQLNRSAARGYGQDGVGQGEGIAAAEAKWGYGVIEPDEAGLGVAAGAALRRGGKGHDRDG